MKVDWKQSKPFLNIFLLVLTSGETDQLTQLNAIFRTKTIIRKDRIEEIEFSRISSFVETIGHKWRPNSLTLFIATFNAEQGSERFCALSRIKGKFELMKKRSCGQFFTAVAS